MKGAEQFRRIVVLGGARSGKSTFAEQLSESLAQHCLYVATATALDDEMAERIAIHRKRRSSRWTTLEEPTRPAVAAEGSLGRHGCVLVEDLTLLLSNYMTGLQPERAADDPEFAVRHQVEALFNLDAHVVLVSNEVGMGLVPETSLGRRFRDALGRINQDASARAEEVFFLVAGIPMRLKPSPSPAIAPASPGLPEL